MRCPPRRTVLRDDGDTHDRAPDDDADTVQRGDGDAFGLLFDRYSRQVHTYCFRRSADWAAAQDLTSTVFLECWRRRDVALTTDTALPWLLGIATNSLRKHHRGLRRHRTAISPRSSPPSVTPRWRRSPPC